MIHVSSPETARQRSTRLDSDLLQRTSRAPAGVAWAHQRRGLAAVLSRPFKPVGVRVLVAAGRG